MPRVAASDGCSVFVWEVRNTNWRAEWDGRPVTCRCWEGRQGGRHCRVHKKQSRRVFRIILDRTDKTIFYKIWRTYSRVHSRNNCSYISNEACVLPIPETSCRTETEIVSCRMQKAGPFDCCCSHQSVTSPSLCACLGSSWTLCDWFVVQCIKIMRNWFLHFAVFTVWLFGSTPSVICLKRFTRYGHYTGEVKDIIIRKLAVVS